MAKMTQYEKARSQEIVKIGDLILDEKITREGIQIFQERLARLRDESGVYTAEALDVLDELEEKGFFSFWQWNLLIPAYLA